MCVLLGVAFCHGCCNENRCTPRARRLRHKQNEFCRFLIIHTSRITIIEHQMRFSPIPEIDMRPRSFHGKSGEFEKTSFQDEIKQPQKNTQFILFQTLLKVQRDISHS